MLRPLAPSDPFPVVPLLAALPLLPSPAPGGVGPRGAEGEAFAEEAFVEPCIFRGMLHEENAQHCISHVYIWQRLR